MITQSLEERMKQEYYWTGKIQMELFRQIRNYLSETGKSQNQFARELGVSKSYMSQVLNGDFDHKLSKFVSLALAIGKVPEVNYVGLEAMINAARGERTALSAVYESSKQKVDLSNGRSEMPVIKSNTNHPSVIFNEVA
ncbi:helix-turn-helix domain-containing protein [Neolewinella persica]|uniref:helix-turn-helix domain-containing protein n=1 Tax=Neolewinella persica TaxID=70998 RepID=UPI00035D4429|nr:helix-turn-helix transcriptional regulator [Neolewinella persica]